jgi:hypothetical protein
MAEFILFLLLLLFCISLILYNVLKVKRHIEIMIENYGKNDCFQLNGKDI